MTDGDFFYADSLVVQECTEGCPCHSVKLYLLDQDGAICAAGSLSPEDARSVARELQELADIADARRLQSLGRLT